MLLAAAMLGATMCASKFLVTMLWVTVTTRGQILCLFGDCALS